MPNAVVNENLHDLALTDRGQNVHAREFTLRLGFSSADEQVTRHWHRQ